MPSNFNAPLSRDQIKIGYVDPQLGYVDGVSICEANAYAQKNPGTIFIVQSNRGDIDFLNINEINNLNVDILVTDTTNCAGIQTYKECGPPLISFYGGGGIAASGNPIIGTDGSILGVDLVSGGYAYQYAPLVSVRDDCNYGSGSKLTAVLGTTVDEYEVYTSEEDFEQYELCEDTEEDYGTRWGPNGEDLGPWDPSKYTQVNDDPIRREIEKYQKYLLSENNPFFTTRKNKPYSITSSKGQTFSNKIDINSCPVRKPDGSSAWGSFMESYAISPVPPSDTPGSDYADVTFFIDYNIEFPYDGDYIFRGGCDNVGKLYVDDSLVGDLSSFAESPATIKKKYNQGKHSVRLELVNKPIPVSSPQFSGLATFEVYGEGGNTKYLSFSFESEDGKESFTIKGVDKSKQKRRDSIKIRPGVRYKVTAKENSKKYKYLEQGLIQEGRKNKGEGIGSSNKIFADYIGSANDNDDMQITAELGRFFSSNKRKMKEGGRDTYDLIYVYDPASDTPRQVTIEGSVETSWNMNPMGVALTIESPKAPVPKEPLPVQEGPCPPNPFWTTRFPGSREQWYPVIYTRGNAWSKFMNRYALSPVPPLDTPGSDRAGVTFKNSWTVDVPYDGYYGFKGTADNIGKLFVDGQKVIDLEGFRTTNPKVVKKFIKKGKHTIEVEVFNQPVISTSNVNQKIFSTKDWQSQPTSQVSNISAKFVQKGNSYFLDVSGSGSGEVSFIMDVNDASYIAGLAAKEIIIPSDNGKIKFTRTGTTGAFGTGGIFEGNNLAIPTQETIKRSGVFTAGKSYGPIQIIGADSYAGKPNVSSNKLGLLDAAGTDENIKLTITSVKSGNSPTGSLTGGTLRDGVVYEGPVLFHHTQTTGGPSGKGWGTFMNDYSVSPKVFKTISEPDRRINGLHTLTWNNVNFPESGNYDIKFQADNIGILKIDGKEVQRTTNFLGEPNVIKTYVQQGAHKITIELTNIPDKTDIFKNNPTGTSLLIERIVAVSESSSQQSWAGGNPMAVSAVMIPPPCRRKRSGKGVVVDVIVEDPGNGYLTPTPNPNNYSVILKLKDVIVKNSGINYNCGVDQILITPDNGVKLDYTCDSFGRIKSVKVVDKGGAGVITGNGAFTSYPSITMPSDTGVNAEFIPVFVIIRDPIEAPADKIIQVTDLVGLKQTGYIDGRAYYGAVFYKDGAKYAGYYETPGKLVQVYDTLQESITEKVTTPASAIPRVGTDVNSNDNRLNIPGTPNTISET